MKMEFRFRSHSETCIYSRRNKLTVMKRHLLLSLLLIGGATTLFAQSDTTKYWKMGFRGTITATDARFTKWAAGSNNSLALNSFARFTANYTKEKIQWQNLVEAAYGFNDQDDVGFRKTDDKLLLASVLSYMVSQDSGKLYWTSGIDFRTQFADGFDFPNDSVRISTFMAPGYLNINSGIRWNPNSVFTLFAAPINGKITIVQDDSLAARGEFGVEPGQNVRTELGLYFRALIAKENLVKNVNFESRAELFGNYIDAPLRHWDLNWETTFLFTINSWLSANLFFHVIYDDDVQFAVIEDGIDTGRMRPEIQYKQVFGLGLTVDLK